MNEDFLLFDVVEARRLSDSYSLELGNLEALMRENPTPDFEWRDHSQFRRCRKLRRAMIAIDGPLMRRKQENPAET